jgi:hypothetical protein
MKRALQAYLPLFLCVAITFNLTAVAQKNASENAHPLNNVSPLGDWRGNSICQVRESACHDEDSLYHVSGLSEKPGWYSLKADKLVDGKPVTMGTTECSYDAKQSTLECTFPRGKLRFTVEEDKMEGAMTLPDKTLWRKISLKKVKS